MTNRQAIILFVTVVGIGLLLYIPSLQPGSGWYNAAEFHAAAMTLDVTHSPGYPLFTRLGNLAIRFGPLLWPGHPPAWYVNMVAALAGTLGAGVFAIWLHIGGVPPLLAGSAAVWMLTFTTFWEEATLGEVYTLEILLLSLFFVGVWRTRSKPPGFWDAALPGFIFGLGLSHRPTFGPLSLVALLMFAVSIFRSPRRTEAAMGAVFGFAVGLLPTYDLYIRLQNPNRVLTDPLTGLGLAGLWSVFTAAEFRVGLGVFTLPEILARTRDWAKLMFENGGPAALVLPWLALRRRVPDADTSLISEASVAEYNPQIWVLGWMFAFNTLFIINYNAFEAPTMLLPSMIGITGLAAHGLHSLRGKRGRRLTGWALAIVAAVSALVSAHNIEPRDQSAELWARRMAAILPPGVSLLVSNDVEFRPFWYLRLAQKFRPDMQLRLIDKIDDDGLNMIAADLSRHAVAGSLIYPANLREKLMERFDLFNIGYLTFVKSVDSKQLELSSEACENTITLADNARIRLASSALPRFMPDANGNIVMPASNTVFPGDLLFYRYTLENIGRDIGNVIIGAVLVGPEGRLFSQNGILLGHDMHAALDGVCPAGNRASEASHKIESLRALIVPDDIPPGRYELRLILCRSSNSGFMSLPVDHLEGLNLLNEDGATEVFRLRNGLAGRQMLRAVPTWKDLKAVAGDFPGMASTPISLGFFDIAERKS
ncbi:MAG: DUF2723 domain-containing protein [Candidatus Riflebacteria bacterium]|nr:DUF2723 domain-containing protein [Candidatus Riflebacteria bacterium]